MFKWFYRRFVPLHQRPVLRAHPLAFWFSLGVVLSGVVAFVHPAANGAPGLALPDVLLAVFQASWTGGGALGVFGITRGKARYEAAGMTLLSASFIAYFLSIVYVLPASAWSGGFIVAIAIGCGRRAWMLTHRNGYERIE